MMEWFQSREILSLVLDKSLIELKGNACREEDFYTLSLQFETFMESSVNTIVCNCRYGRSGSLGIDVDCCRFMHAAPAR